VQPWNYEVAPDHDDREWILRSGAAGHMLYTKKSCLDGLHGAMADFYGKALPTP